MDKFLTKREVADYLHVSEQTIDNHVKRGLFHPVRVGRRLYFPQSEIEKLLTPKYSNNAEG